MFPSDPRALTAPSTGSDTHSSSPAGWRPPRRRSCDPGEHLLPPRCLRAQVLRWRIRRECPHCRERTLRKSETLSSVNLASLSSRMLKNALSVREQSSDRRDADLADRTARRNGIRLTVPTRTGRPAAWRSQARVEKTKTVRIRRPSCPGPSDPYRLWSSHPRVARPVARWTPQFA